MLKLYYCRTIASIYMVTIPNLRWANIRIFCRINLVGCFKLQITSEYTQLITQQPFQRLHVLQILITIICRYWNVAVYQQPTLRKLISDSNAVLICWEKEEQSYQYYIALDTLAHLIWYTGLIWPTFPVSLTAIEVGLVTNWWKVGRMEV